MKETIKKIVSSILVISLVLMLLSAKGKDAKVVFAADNTLKICIGESSTARHHRAMSVGAQTEELFFVLKEGTAETSEYVSNNPSSFRVINTVKGKCKIEALKEGSGLVTLTVKTTEGEILTEKLFISVYTRIEDCKGVVNKDTSAYMGASTNSGVENYDNKGNISAKTSLTITATCNEFYVFKTLDGATFEDGKDTGFIKKKDVDILANNIEINSDSTSISIGEHTKINAYVTPTITANSKVEWITSDSNIASVDSEGEIEGKSEGTIIITAKTKDGTNKEDSVYISVYKEKKQCKGYLTEDCKLYKIADDKFERGLGEKGCELIIEGQCKNYYWVKMSTNSVFSDGNESNYCYVEKSKINIPVAEIELSEEEVMLTPKDTLQLTVTISPDIANNQEIVWSSNDSKVAIVDSNGKVTAKKIGMQ